MPWYRPTRLNHVIPGAEFGWRSGWAKWPDYFADSLPPVVELGRGSPAGIEVYNHFMFPQRYHNALFVCDWSRGRILAIRTKPHGATYKAIGRSVRRRSAAQRHRHRRRARRLALFLHRRPRHRGRHLSRRVGRQGAARQCSSRGKGIAAALDQPQLNSAWARQQRWRWSSNSWAKNWGSELADDRRRSPSSPVRSARAGPGPDAIVRPASAQDRCWSKCRTTATPALRPKAAYLMGLHSDRRRTRTAWSSCWKTRSGRAARRLRGAGRARQQPLAPSGWCGCWLRPTATWPGPPAGLASRCLTSSGQAQILEIRRSARLRRRLGRPVGPAAVEGDDRRACSIAAAS